ncbi:hypothetical protein [Fibrobacter sp. UWH4]|uniref:hypothetical protein n=1 Tax=Fibrobacter sp. UWH4 TaxID=1896210 RepID=UPI00091AED10|nr:hypothetical protein [Fibrobacter sp. UWH4]SHL24485.1 hypothetical protein SAMN05720762_10528 [Fibrobacter sp. UWH4]
MARGILWIALAVCTLLLVGCSVAIIHPPSAATFMEKSDGDYVMGASASAFFGDLVDDEAGVDYVADGIKEVERSDDWNDEWYYKSKEWPIGGMFSLQRNKGYFKYGLGFDFLTPYVQAGFVSDYFGVMGWSNLWLWQLEKVEHKYFQWGGGISLIEQLPIGDNSRIGMTQHLSRNGREANTAQHGAMVIGMGRSAPVFYDEIGCGGYASFMPNESLRIGVEFRYGRDLTYKRREYSNYPEKYEKFSKMDRFSVTISIISTFESMAFSIKKQEKTQTEMKAAEERQKERDLESLEEYEKRQNGAEE